MPFDKEMFFPMKYYVCFPNKKYDTFYQCVSSIQASQKEPKSYAFLCLIFSLGKYSSFIWKIIHGCSGNKLYHQRDLHKEKNFSLSPFSGKKDCLIKTITWIQFYKPKQSHRII